MIKKEFEDRIHVSCYNSYDEVVKNLTIPDKIIIYDTTLRDGEQTPGVSFSLEQKLGIARLLDEIGIPQIEAGFPVVSKEERRTIAAIAKEDLNADILALTRLKRSEVDLALDCDVDMVLLLIASSELHRKHKLMRSYNELEECILDVVEYSKAHGLKTSFSTEDSTRAGWEINESFFTAALNAGADRIGITDTVGCVNPDGIRYLVEKVKHISSKPVSLHLHNDFGLAVANAIAGVLAGAEAVSTTANGIGERAGNLSLFEFVASMELLYGHDFGFKLEKFKQLSEMVSEYSKIPVPRNLPLVGENIFAHESGIHVAAVLNNPSTYESIPPELVGNKRRLIMGKHTGTTMVREKLSEQSVSATKNEVEQILEIVKARGEANGSVGDTEFWKIANHILNGKQV